MFSTSIVLYTPAYCALSSQPALWWSWKIPMGEETKPIQKTVSPSDANSKASPFPNHFLPETMSSWSEIIWPMPEVSSLAETPTCLRFWINGSSSSLKFSCSVVKNWETEAFSGVTVKYDHRQSQQEGYSRKWLCKREKNTHMLPSFRGEVGAETWGQGE